MAPNSTFDDGVASRGVRAPERNTDHFYGLNYEAPHHVHFTIKGVDLPVINSARRSVISEAPTVGVGFDPANPSTYDSNNPFSSGFKATTNTTILNHEQIFRQLSMIPICVDENRLDGYDPNTFKFILKVKNTTDHTITVKSSDIRVLDSTDAEVKQSVRDALFPPCPITKDHIIVVRLRPSPTGTGDGDEIDVEFRARLGTGRENACWSPTNKCVFGFVRDEATFERNFNTHLDEIKSKAPEGSIISREDIARIKQQFSTLEGQRAFATDEDDNPVAVLFTIETVNRLNPAFVFFQALRVLSKKVRDFNDEFSNASGASGAKEGDGGWGTDDFSATPSRVKIVQQPNMDDMFEITVYQEGHTLGNLVQGLLYRHWNLKGNYPSKSKAAFFGYSEPHPSASSLEDHIVFNIKVNPGDDLVRVMNDGLSWCVKLIDDLSIEFAEFADLRKIKIVEETVKMIGKM